MMKTDFQIEEYKRLTTEIENSSRRIFQIITIIITFSTAIIGITLKEKPEFYWPLILQPLLIIALFLISSQFNAIYRIATYIELFYENKATNIFWESNLRTHKKNTHWRSKYGNSIYSIAVVFGCISLLVSLIIISSEHFGECSKKSIIDCVKIITNEIWKNPRDFIIFAIVLVISVYGYFQSFKSIKDSKDIDDHFDSWRDMRQ